MQTKRISHDAMRGKHMEGRNTHFKPTYGPRPMFFGSPGHTPEDWRRKDEDREEN